MTIEAMIALGCLVIRPFGQHKQAALSQNLKQSVSTNLDSLIRLAMQQIVQFTCTQSWLTYPDFLNKLDNPICLVRFAVGGSIALVVSLSANA
ncbi:hypothetical protein N430_05394 [Pseudomonas sp. CC120222-01a]|nr:hypothetical protein N430_05394 [Pseudomonas sp. CC120222-01a]